MEVARYTGTALKGFFMGAANVIPGVSGGTIALISGIYGELIESLNALMSIKTWRTVMEGKWKEFWKTIHGGFLLSLMLGVFVSVFSLAKLMEYCLHYHPIQTWAFFFGLIIASAGIMLRDIRGWKVSDAIITVTGIALGFVVCTLSPTQTPDDMWFIFICGAIAICTMILPGISGSFILVILGKYDYIMSSISSLNWPVLIVFAIGCAVGILAFAKFLHWLLGKWEKQTMLTLVGFVIGSLVKVWPWSDKAALEAAQTLRTGAECSALDLQLPSAVLWMVAGQAVIVVMEAWKKRREI